VWADILDVSKGIGLDSRIWSKFLQAGTWYGGSCFPKDVQALIHTGQEYGYAFRIPQAVEEVNSMQKTKAIQYLKKKFATLQSQNITIRGVSFKPWTDDTRASPTRVLLDYLIQQWAVVSLCDPEWITPYRLEEYPPSSTLHYPQTLQESLDQSSVLLLMTSRDEYQSADIALLEGMKTKNIYDARNMWASRELNDDIEYTWIWRC
jgi:UDPglucose 6-dehydrogenase